MKNSKLTILTICLSFFLYFKSVNAQFTYEHTFTIPLNGGTSVYVTDIGNNNYKWVATDYGTNQFSLYNLDYTPFMINVPIAVPTYGGALQVGYITTSLFDCDSTTVKYAVMPQNPNDTETFSVYKTDGTLLFSRDSVTALWGYGEVMGSIFEKGIENTPAGTKLILLNNHYQQFIYGLCGLLPESIEKINQSNSYVQEFPNPTSHEIYFHIISPNNYETFVLTIFDSSFKPVKTTTISGIKTQISLDTESLSSGTYIYSLQSKNKIFQTGKIIITK